MDNKTLEALLDLLDLMVDEIGIDVDNIIKTLAQRTFEVLSPHIDADRMGELVLESKLNPDYFDEHLAEH